ncbi:MAG: hypothetical protein ACR2NP_20960 [Pirellulaceae bacterium]
MSSPSGSESLPLVWVSKHHRLPQTCITCGMFTDQLVSVKYTHNEQRAVSSGEATSKIALGCLLHLLGPIGWIVAMMLAGDDKQANGNKTVSVSGKIKVPQCRMCAGQAKVKAVNGNMSNGSFAFEVHPRFAARLQAVNVEDASR